MECQKEDKKVLCGVFERDEDRKSQSNQKRVYELHGLSTQVLWNSIATAQILHLNAGFRIQVRAWMLELEPRVFLKA